ncbi:probable E3 ubiquitin-protein ligase MARCHF10 [Mesoplodon densirostris]|uniref:probable E3 ubiquitin-protein ligase MARCHF10 n=1 Tax=Mesoplodon densirostris TaxID=48708 RepID=UPI0028DB05E1|nr:probable E3 ubiquitin-protein ligase MARCHF10 [Mesoplodon densirostris]
MFHKARDRQKFVSDVQYLRDMQYKADSEYQACLRRQEYRRDPNGKRRDHFWGQETNFRRSRFSSWSSSKQSSGEEDALAKPRLSAKSTARKSDYRLPAIDQTSVKQKHKSTMTPKKSEKVGPSKPYPAAHASQILSRKRRPSLTVSPEMQSPRASGDRHREKLQLPGKAPALRRVDPIVQQEGHVWTSDTKLKRPTRERRNLVPSSQPITVMENTRNRARKRDLSALSQKEPHPALSQAFRGTNSPRELTESLGPPLVTTTLGGPRRTMFRFRDEDFYSVLSSNSRGENDDTEEETHVEEELLLAGMHLLHSPSNHKRSRFLGTSATQAKNKSFEENPANCRVNSVRRSQSSHGSLRISSAMQLGTGQPSIWQGRFQDPGRPDGGSAKEKDSSNSENEKSFRSWDTKSGSSLEDDLNAENVFRDVTSMEDRPGTHDYERDWQAHLSESNNPLGCFLAGRPTAPRSSMSSSYNTPGSFMHSALRDDAPIDLSTSSTLAPSSDSEGSSRFNVRQPLSPTRNRNLFASAENHSYFPVNSVQEFDVRGEDITSTSQSQEAPLHTEDLLLNPQSSLSLVESSSSSPSGRNLQDHLHVPRSLQENIPFTFYAVSEFPNQNDNGSSMEVPGIPDEKEATKTKAYAEKLKNLQESLLEEDSEEDSKEEGDLCRICQIAGGSPANPLVEPCGCVGSLRFVHSECLKRWLKARITSGANLDTVKTCEMCKQSLLVDLDDFNVTEFYQNYLHSWARNQLMNPGSFLVPLLHFYEERFAELMGLDHNQDARETLSRNYPEPGPEENESSEWRDGNESSIRESNNRAV